MTSFAHRPHRPLHVRPTSVADPRASDPARRVLAVAIAVSAGALVLAVIGLALDPRTIGGEPAWVKPVKFGVSITLYFMTLRWMLGALRGHRRLTTAVALVTSTAFALETLWIDVQVVRGVTSHFNTAGSFDATTYNAAGAVVSTIFMATIVIAVLALRIRGLDAGVAAGIRWGLGVCLLGMAEAVSMLLNGTTSTTSGAHTVGGPDGGPGLPLLDWSLVHGDLRIGHFVGLHAMQALPLLAWLLLRFTRLDESSRRDLLRVAGVGTAALVVLVWWQAERGQPLLAPDAATLAATGALLLGIGAATGLIFSRPNATVTGRTTSKRSASRATP